MWYTMFLFAKNPGIATDPLKQPTCVTFSSPRVQTLMKGLSPAYLRLGGTSADYVVFSNEPIHAFYTLNSKVILHSQR